MAKRILALAFSLLLPLSSALAAAPPAIPAPSDKAKLLDDFVEMNFGPHAAEAIDDEARRIVLEDPRITENQDSLIKQLAATVPVDQFRKSFRMAADAAFTVQELEYLLAVWHSALSARYTQLMRSTEDPADLARELVKANFKQITHLDYHDWTVKGPESWVTRAIWRYFPETRLQEPCACSNPESYVPNAH